MALWTTTAIISEKDTLNTYESVGIIVESAQVNAVASAQVTDTPIIYLESVQCDNIAIATTVDDYTNISLGAVVNLVPIVTGTSSLDWTVAAVTIPSAEVTGTGTTLGIGVGSCVTQPIEVTGILLHGSISTGDAILPLPIVKLRQGNEGSIENKLPIINATGLTGLVGQAAVNNARTQINGTLIQTAIWVGDVTQPSAIVSGVLANGKTLTGSVQNKISVVNGIGLHGSIGIGAVSSTEIEVKASLIGELIITGDIILPVHTVRAFSSRTISSFNTWVLNAQSGQVSNYTNFPLIGMGILNGQPIGATADGIYLLTGDDDAGEAIEASFSFGMADFRSELDSVTDVYIGGELDGEIEIGILEEGQDIEHLYAIANREQHVRGHHAKLGKGFRARHRQLSISNTNGSNFNLNSLTLPTKDLKGNE